MTSIGAFKYVCYSNVYIVRLLVKMTQTSCFKSLAFPSYPSVAHANDEWPLGVNIRRCICTLLMMDALNNNCDDKHLTISKYSKRTHAFFAKKFRS